MMKPNATGITIQSVFSAWPRDEVCEIRLEAGTFADDATGSVRSVFAGGCFPSRRISSGGADSVSGKLNARMKHASGRSSSAVGRAIRYVRADALALVDLSPMVLSLEVLQAVDSYAPDVIYSCGGSVSVMKLVCRLSERYEAPVILHFMDDWPHHIPAPLGPLRRLWRRRLRTWLDRCYSNSYACLAISSPMAAAFEQERGIPHLALMNSVNPDLFDCGHRARGRSVVFVYAGGLHLGRWEALKSLEGAIARAATRNDLVCQLRVYTTSDSEQHASSFSSQTTEFLPPIPARHVKGAYEGADVLVHVESLDPSWLGFIRYSISTKIPEYL
ncbi:MAG: glycosyltransferase family protein, partial [Thiobacillus sp.]